MIILKSMAICTKLEQINTINVQLLIFRAKNLAGWMEGRMEGRKEVKTGLRIAYSNQKCNIWTCFFASLFKMQQGAFLLKLSQAIMYLYFLLVFNNE